MNNILVVTRIGGYGESLLLFFKASGFFFLRSCSYSCTSPPPLETSCYLQTLSLLLDWPRYPYMQTLPRTEYQMNWVSYEKILHAFLLEKWNCLQCLTFVRYFGFAKVLFGFLAYCGEYSRYLRLPDKWPLAKWGCNVQNLLLYKIFS